MFIVLVLFLYRKLTLLCYCSVLYNLTALALWCYWHTTVKAKHAFDDKLVCPC